jgi:hypothetical protein
MEKEFDMDFLAEARWSTLWSWYMDNMKIRLKWLDSIMICIGQSHDSNTGS